MKRFTISRGYTHVHSIQIDAETYEEAEKQAKETSLLKWKDCGGAADDTFYQCEGEEDLPDTPPVDFIRLYEAQAIECKKCDNWEEGDAPWGSFEHDGKNDFYTCGKCGSQCVKESEIREWRDEE